jgi:hypothetical protein
MQLVVPDLAGGLTVAERRFCRYPAFMSVEMAFVGGDGMHCSPLRKDRSTRSRSCPIDNEHCIAVTVTQDGK